MAGDTFLSVSASIAPLDSHWKPKGEKEDNKQYKEDLTYNGGLSSQIWRPKDNGTAIERKAAKEYSDPYLSAPLNPKLVCHWKREATDSSDVISTDKDTTSSGTVETCSCCPPNDSSDSANPAISVDHLFQNKKNEKMKNSESEKSIVMDSPSEKQVKAKIEKEITKIGESIDMNSSSSSISPSSFDSSLEIEKLAQKSQKMSKKMKEIGRKKAVKEIIISDVSSSDVSSFIPIKKIKKNKSKTAMKKIVEKIREQKKVDFDPKPLGSNICDIKREPIRSSSYINMEAIQMNEWSERKYWLLLVFFLLFVYFYRLFILQQNCC